MRIHFTLTPAQRAELETLRDHAAKPYLRERAAALLKVAAGLPLTTVAQHGLLQVRAPETVGSWVARYRTGGVPALTVAPGRGRKPVFSPSAAPGRRGRPR
jgi:hypothetical protein